MLPSMLVRTMTYQTEFSKTSMVVEGVWTAMNCAITRLSRLIMKIDEVRWQVSMEVAGCASEQLPRGSRDDLNLIVRRS
jgi:hypothetical protein